MADHRISFVQEGIWLCVQRPLELSWERGQRFLKVRHREFVVGVEVDKIVRALSLHQEQMEHVPGLRCCVEGSSTIAGRKRQILQFSLEDLEVSKVLKHEADDPRFTFLSISQEEFL